VVVAEEVIGRGSELMAIDQFLVGARAGLAGLVIQGEAGIGKTTLWEASVAAARDRGFQVLTSRPAKAESSLALAAFGDLFSPVPPEAVARLPDPQRHAVEVALLRADPAGVPADQRTLSVATASLLQGLTEVDGPLLAIVTALATAATPRLIALVPGS
jgi:hypothetical protein